MNKNITIPTKNQTKPQKSRLKLHHSPVPRDSSASESQQSEGFQELSELELDYIAAGITAILPTAVSGVPLP